MPYDRQKADGQEGLSDEEYEAYAYLRHRLGFDVEPVPATNEHKTADFRVNGDGAGYLVEVASRFLPDEVFKKPLERNALWDPKIQNWLAEARKQCQTIDPNHERLWFIWGSAEGPIAPKAQLERVFNTAFAIHTYLDIESTEGDEITAFYAKPPLFQRYPQIDAMFCFADEVGLGFLPNEFSPRLEHVMNSELAKRLQALGVPVKLPADYVGALSCVVPASVDRSDQGAVLKYVQQTMGRPMLSPTASDIQWMSGLRIPREVLEADAAKEHEPKGES